MLQLLQLAAPPELVQLAPGAIADETRHARQAFGVASVLSETQLGPGALEVSGSLRESSLLEVVQLVVREGRIGETCAGSWPEHSSASRLALPKCSAASARA